MKLAVDHLPITARRIVEVIGLDATLALVVGLGGRTLVPSWSNHQAEIADHIGDADAARLGAMFREPLSIPTCDKAVRAAVRQAIRTEFDRLTSAEGLSARAAVDKLAGRPPLRYTDRHIWRILSSIDEGRVLDVAQGELF